MAIRDVDVDRFQSREFSLDELNCVERLRLRLTDNAVKRAEANVAAPPNVKPEML